jgi:hypothetical protein
MGVDISISDIDIAHRIPMRKAAGNHVNQANDPIVCKFVRRMAQEKVLITRNNTSQISASNLKFPPTIKVDRISIFSHFNPEVAGVVL